MYHYLPVGLRLHQYRPQTNFALNIALCHFLFHRNNTNCVVLTAASFRHVKSSRRMDSITDSVWYRELRNSGQLVQAAIAIVTVIVLTVIRRRFFSPIRSIPGPFWASITRLWHLRQVATGKQNLKLIEQHEKHGMIPSGPADMLDYHLSASRTHRELVGQGTSCAWRRMKSASTTRMLSRLCS